MTISLPKKDSRLTLFLLCLIPPAVYFFPTHRARQNPESSKPKKEKNQTFHLSSEESAKETQSSPLKRPIVQEQFQDSRTLTHNLPLNQSLPLPAQLKKSETLLLIILNPQKNQDLQTLLKSS